MTAMQTFVHEFISPINRYKALAVRQGFVTIPVHIYEDRQCCVLGEIRTRRRKGWGYYNILHVKFVDDGSTAMIPAGKFNKAVKAAPIGDEE